MVKIKAQMKIQQTAFMIIAVFIFFILAGLIFLGYQLKDITKNYNELQKDQAVSSIAVIANMPELSCGDLCLDEDKLEIMQRNAQKGNYSEFWPVSSIEVYRLFPNYTEKQCPGKNCTYYNIYDSGQKEIRKYSTYVSICKIDYPYEKCDIGKLVIGAITKK